MQEAGRYTDSSIGPFWWFNIGINIQYSLLLLYKNQKSIPACPEVLFRKLLHEYGNLKSLNRILYVSPYYLQTGFLSWKSLKWERELVYSKNACSVKMFKWDMGGLNGSWPPCFILIKQTICEKMKYLLQSFQNSLCLPNWPNSHPQREHPQGKFWLDVKS